MFYIFYISVFLLAFLPLGILYFIADCLYPLVYYVFRYRRKIVRGNLQRSFPEKSAQEIRQIEKRFYRYFCDLTVETLHLWRMDEKEIRRRIRQVDFDVMENFLHSGKIVMLATAHYCNWEWGSTIPAVLDRKFEFWNVYKQLTNRNFDNFMKTVRNRSGGVNVEMKTLLRKIYTLRAENRQAVIAMIADQRPQWGNVNYRTQFLNQTTSVITGTEHLAKKFGCAVVFGHIYRVRRGYYEFRYSTLSENPATLPEHQLTDLYMKKLEEIIREKPECWLWTHNRWAF